MKFYQYQMPIRPLGATDALKDASTEDLRVLLCLMEHGGRVDSETLSRDAFVGEKRVSSALFYFEEAGILSPIGDGNYDVDGNVISEYERTIPKKDKRKGAENAQIIKDEGLSDLFDQCTELLKKPALNPSEMSAILSLIRDEGVSAEFVVLVLNDMQNLAHPTVAVLEQRVAKYIKGGIKTPEDLQEFFLDRDKKVKWEWSIMKICGIRNRALTAEETTAFAKWSEVFGYGTEILTLAYDYTVRGAGKYSVAYMDKILSSWFDAGAMTVDACEKQHMQNRPEEFIGEKKRPGRKKDADKFATFDPDEAFQNALARSYGTEEKK